MREISRNIVGILLVSQDGKIFIVKSNPAYKGSYEGYWVIPGGGIEEDESTKDAAIRETLEETGIDISKYNLELINNTRKGTTEKTLKTGERVFVKMNFSEYRVVLNDKIADSISVILSNEHSEYKWLSPSELAKVKLSPPTEGFCRELGYIN
jgi:8-oxo-dGTP pyrophosphatase MutT (NUDIX family)